MTLFLLSIRVYTLDKMWPISYNDSDNFGSDLEK